VVGPVVCPPQPTGLSVAAQDSGAVVAWVDVLTVVEGELAALGDDGVEDLPAAADVVTDIRVTVTAVADASDQQVVTVAGEATQARVSGLRNGVEYAVSVIAFGEFGAGPVSESIVFSPTTGVEGEIGGVLLKRDDAAKAAPASQSASNIDGVAVTDDGEVLDGVDKVALSEAVDVAEGEAIARTIEAQPEVQWAEPDLVVLPAAVPASTDGSGTDSRSGWNITGEYGVGKVTDPDAGAGVTVAVIDTGITAHPDLDGRLVAGFDFVSNPEVLAAPRSEGGQPVSFDGDYVNEATYGALGRDADPTDPGEWRGVAPVRDSSWHGTHTAGVIVDVVPGAKIQPIRALSWRGGLLSDVAAGIRWASGGAVDGVPANATPSKVINLSFSVQAACPNTLQTAIDDAVARGSVIVAAAGNNNADATGYAPGNCANVITVGATNADGKRASYSNYGTVVDFAAPGGATTTDGGVTAASNTGTTIPAAPTSAAREGTSIAAAHAAAALALITSNNPDATPTQRSEILTGQYLRDFPGEICDTTADKTCGLGLLQIASGPVPFTCQPKLYQSATPGPRLFEYDPVTNTYSTVGPATSGGWNGMGYNTVDDFIYGNNSSDKKLFRLDSTGTYESLGYLGTTFNSGDFWGEDRLLMGSSGSNAWKSVDVSDPSNPVMTNFTLTGDTFGRNAADFTVLGSTAYGLSPNGNSAGMTLSVVNLNTQVVVNKTTSGARVSGGTGAAYADALGNVYFHVNGGSVYKVASSELSKANPEVVSMGSPPTFGGSTLAPANDGASCPNAGSAFSATISNEASAAVSANSAQVTADVNPNGASTTAVICYGLTSATSGGALQSCTETANPANASSDSPLTGTSATSLTSVSITGLDARTTYYWQVVTTSSYTTTYGTVASFTTTGTPITTTRAASGISTTTATLNGLVNPGNRSTTVDFCYGTASELTGCTSIAASQSPVSGTSDVSVSVSLTGLTPGARYYARVSATNDDGTTSGTIISFTTLDVPSTTLSAATDVTSTDARLNGSIDPKGLSTTVEFCYGTSADLTGCTAVSAAESPLVAVNASVGVTADLTGLTPSTTYYVRVSATNSNGSASSSVGSFTTSARPLVLTTTTGSLTTGTVGSVYAKTLSADGGTAPYTWDVVAGSLPAGLSLNSTTGAITGTPTFDGSSSFTIEVTDATTQTATKAFTISVVDGPTAVTTAASSVGTTTTVVNGTVDPGNLVTSAGFCFGTASDLTGCTEISADQSPLSAGPSTVAVSSTLTGLTPGTTYYARTQATNSSGSDNGNIVSFTTTSAPEATSTAAIFRDKAGSAILTGSIDPGGLSTSVNFCWGTTPTLVGCTSVAAEQSRLSASHGSVLVSKEVSGLTQGETHYFNVTATNSAGTDVGSTVEFTMPLIDAPSPTITGVSPASGDAGGGTSVTITGTNFSTAGSGPTVSIGGTAATVTSFTATSITVTTPAGTPGAVDVIVFNLDGQAVRETTGFTYTSATTYSLTYNANGASSGSAPTDATSYAYGDQATIASAGTLARTGFEFAGWNTSEYGLGNAYSVGATPAITEDVTLYAQWTAVADLATSAPSLSFGRQAVGSRSLTTRTVALSNSGAAIVTINTPGVALSGSGAGDFSVSGGSCSDGGTLSAFASCTVEATFDPQRSGATSATLSIATSEGTQTVALAGIGTGSSRSAPGDTSSGGSSSGGGLGARPPLPPGAVSPPPRASLPVGVVLGSGVMVIDGEVVPVRPERAPSGGKWSVRGDDFSLEFVPQVRDSGLLEGPEETLRAPVGGQVQVTGGGYLGESSVSVYLVPPELMGFAARASGESIFLGDVTVRADGAFDVTLTIPPSVDSGDFVLQVNGWSQDAAVRSVNMNMDVYEELATRSLTKAAFFQGRAPELSMNGKRKLRTMVTALPKVRQNVRVDITAVSVSLDDLENDLRLAARRGRELRDYLSERGVQGTYSVTIRTEDQLRSADKTPALIVSSKGKPLTTVRITYDAPQ